MGGLGSARTYHIGAASKVEHWRSVDLVELKRMGLLKPIVGGNVRAILWNVDGRVDRLWRDAGEDWRALHQTRSRGHPSRSVCPLRFHADNVWQPSSLVRVSWLSTLLPHTVRCQQPKLSAM